MLSLINTCNMEAPTESQCSTDEARDWPAILVSLGHNISSVSYAGSHALPLAIEMTVHT